MEVMFGLDISDDLRTLLPVVRSVGPTLVYRRDGNLWKSAGRYAHGSSEVSDCRHLYDAISRDHGHGTYEVRRGKVARISIEDDLGATQGARRA